MHGARDVHHKDVVTRGDGGAGHRLRGLDHGQEEVLGVAPVEHHARLHVVAGKTIVEDEVAVVGRIVIGRERDVGALVVTAFALYAHFVRGGAHRLQWHRGLQGHAHVKARWRGLALWQVGLGGPTGLGLAGLRAVVAGAHHGGKHELVVARLRHQQLGVAQLDAYFIARQDVGHVHLEHIGQVLLQQRGGFAFCFGLLVGNAGLLLLTDFGGDDPVAQAHLHAVHRGARGTGENILGLDGA